MKVYDPLVHDTLEVEWDRWEDPGGHDGPRHSPGPLEAAGIDGEVVFTYAAEAVPWDDIVEEGFHVALVEPYCDGVALRVTEWEAEGRTGPGDVVQIILRPLDFDADALGRDAADADEARYGEEMDRRIDEALGK